MSRASDLGHVSPGTTITLVRGLDQGHNQKYPNYVASIQRQKTVGFRTWDTFALAQL